MLVNHAQEPDRVRVIDFGLTHAHDVSAARVGSLIKTCPYRLLTGNMCNVKKWLSYENINTHTLCWRFDYSKNTNVCHWFVLFQVSRESPGPSLHRGQRHVVSGLPGCRYDSDMLSAAWSLLYISKNLLSCFIESTSIFTLQPLNIIVYFLLCSSSFASCSLFLKVKMRNIFFR